MISKLFNPTILEVSEETPALRYEQKFATDYASLSELDLIVKLSPDIFTCQFPDRWVNNIYFDDDEFSAYKENLEGVCNREKLRIRWYGSLLNSNVEPKLEVKRKFGSVGDKVKTSLPKWNNLPRISFINIENLLTKSVNWEQISVQFMDKKVTLCNRYLRSYYVSANSQIRLTIDRNIAYSAIDDFSGFEKFCECTRGYSRN